MMLFDVIKSHKLQNILVNRVKISTQIQILYMPSWEFPLKLQDNYASLGVVPRNLFSSKY